MKIKSLLLGSAAALVAVSGARAADAVIIPEPEMVEYVRVCDAAGTGYFYIPGTETCLKISGYVRYEMNFADNGDDSEGGDGDDIVAAYGDGDGDWGKRSDVQVNIEAWNDTEFGPLYSRIRLGYDSAPSQDGDNDESGFSIDHAVITLAGVTMGKNASWWDWTFGEDGGDFVDLSPGDRGMIAYTVNAGGFAWTLAAEEDESGDYTPDFVFDVNGAVGAFGLHAGAAYNESEEAWTVRAAGSYDFGAAALTLGFQWSDEDHLGADYLANYEWVVGGDVAFDATEKLAVRGGLNYGIDDDNGDDAILYGAGVNYVLVTGFDIDARVQYQDFLDDQDDDFWTGRLRFTRSF